MSKIIPDVDHCYRHNRFYDMEDYCSDCMRVKLSALEKDNQRLRDALQKHGRHLDICFLNRRGIVCNCGLMKALANSGEEGKVKR